VPDAKEFDEILKAELEQIDARRRKRDLADPPSLGGAVPGAPPVASTPLEKVRQEAHQRNLVGLAFSGGGIRSATFNLGILQALAGLDLLKRFDYLSTVSGGGYIGAWLVTWMKRRQDDLVNPGAPGAALASGAADVEKTIQPAQEQKAATQKMAELDPIGHLRGHSNYLAPRQGFFSIDSWVLWALYLRNFLLNQLVLLPSVVIVLLLSRLVMFAYYPAVDGLGRLHYVAENGTIERVHLTTWWCILLMGVTAAAMTVAIVNVMRAIHMVRQEREQRAHPKKPGWLLGWVVMPLLAAAVAFCPLIPNALSWTPSNLLRQWQAREGSISYFLEADLEKLAQWHWWIADLALYMAVAAVAIMLTYHIISSIRAKFNWVVRWWCFFTGLTWGAMLYGAYRVIDWFYVWDGLVPWLSLQISATAHMTTFGPPLLLLTVVLAISLAIGLLRKEIGEELREWLASLCGWLMRAAVIWAAVNVVALYGTALVLWAGPSVQTALGSAWLLTVAGGVLAGNSETTGAPRPQNIFREYVARGSLPVFVIGIFILVSLLVHKVIDKPPIFNLEDEAIAPFHYETKHPSTHVQVTRKEGKGRVVVERKRDYLQVTDDESAITQQYWLGMLNTGDHVNQRYKFWISTEDVDFLKKNLPRGFWSATNPAKNAVKVESLRPREKWKYSRFRPRLDQVAKDVAKIAPDNPIPTQVLVDHGQKKLDEKNLVAGAAALVGGSSLAPLGSSIAVIDMAFLEEFEFKIAFLQDPSLPEDTKRLLKENLKHKDVWLSLEMLEYKLWYIEEFEDTLDEVFPDGWDLGVKSLILQRVKGGLEPSVEIHPGWFLFKIGACLAACVFVLLLAASQVDVNAFSLHGLYLNRLVRAYLGASRKPEPVTGSNPKKRKPDPVTGFDPDDDLFLTSLKSNHTQSYDGPFLIVNAAMNLVHGENLAWQERMAESFVLTPEYCGSETTGYRPTDDGLERYAGGVKLGTAVAISGAAASPNMGYHSSPAITFLLTVFNARLGAWLGNPKHEECWQDRGPRWGFLYLFRELFGWTDDKSPYVYLSDGGHFENLGAYELIKRRCRFVVVCDAGEDGLHSFEDLGNLVRKVRIDLGIRIELSPDCLQLQKDSRHSRWHCAIGKIRYDEVDTETYVGTLVYIKPSLTGDESADVLHYAASHPTFPHEGTIAHQFFTESQFESYRALGEHIGESVFKQSVDDANANDREEERMFPNAVTKGPKHARWCRELFASVVRRWFAMPPEYDANFVTSTHGYIDLQEAWRNDARLWRLTLDVYPELDPDGSRRPAGRETKEQCASREAAELHLLLQMLQVVENAYLSLNLEKYYAHPLNRGWMDVFHRWTNAETFRKHWPTLRSEFARDFVRFCEGQMRKGEVTGIALPLDRQRIENLPPRLLQEFDKEWPDYKDEQGRKLQDAINGQGTLVWAIHSVRASKSISEIPERTDFPVGLIAVWPKAVPASTGPKEYFLFVWQRGAYRNAGLGRQAVRSVLEELKGKFARPFQLRVCLDISSLTGPGGKLQKAIWLTFFNQLDFVRTRLPTGQVGDTLLELHRDFL
jgi:hypothetical protein